jgi:hypothetical protein
VEILEPAPVIHAAPLAKPHHSASQPVLPSHVTNEIALLQIQFDENQAQSRKRVFQEYPPFATTRAVRQKRIEPLT